MANTIRYRAVCKTCGLLDGTWRFQEDALNVGEQHQNAHTFRIFRSEPADPAHAPMVERRLDDGLWINVETIERELVS